MSQELEQARRAAIRNRIVRWGVCVGLPLLAAISGIIEKDWKLAIGAFVILSYILFGLWAAFSKNRALANYRALFKKEMIKLALNGATLYEKTEFAFDRGLNPSLVSGSGMFTTNRYLSDCYISGVHNGVQFHQADIRNVSGDKNGYHLEYDGTFIAFPTSLSDATQTNVYHKDVDVSIIVPGEKIKSGREGFDKLFRVATNNVPRAQALLTDEFCNKLLQVQELTERKIALTVKNGWIYIFMPNKKSVLRPKLFTRYDNSMKTAIVKELELAKHFIDAFR